MGEHASAATGRASSDGQDGRRGDVDIAAIGALLADRARCRILMALDSGQALPASRLAAEAGVAASTTSNHLGKLVDGGLLTVEAHGRHRYYRIADPTVGQLIENLSRLAPAQPVGSLRQSTRAQQLREARTCYDHLAGGLGVGLMRTMIDRGHLTGGDGTYDPDRDQRAGYRHDIDYHLSDAGQAFLTDFGVVLPERPVVRYCVDWSERHHHLSGAIGRILLTRMVELDWVHRKAGHRAVTLTKKGHTGLRDHFALTWPPSNTGAAW